MKYFFATLMLSLSLLLPIVAEAAAPVEVDVLYMNHGPLQPTLDKLKGLIAGYGEKIAPRWHDFESKEGEQFMAAKSIRQHVPLMIWINGKEAVSGFPSGSGPQMFQGKWTMEALAKALDQATQPH
jgi:hypothetical protein